MRCEEVRARVKSEMCASGDVGYQGSLIMRDSVDLRLTREKLSNIAVNMLTAAMLSALLMLGGVAVVAAANLQVYGKSFHGDKTLLGSNEGRHSARKQPRQQVRHIYWSISFFQLICYLFFFKRERINKSIHGYCFESQLIITLFM